MGGVSRVGEALPRSVAARAASVKPCPRPPASCVRPGVVTVIAGKSCMGRGSCLGGKRRRKWGEGERGEETNGNHPLGLGLEPHEWVTEGGFGCSSRDPAGAVFLVWALIFNYGSSSGDSAGVALREM